MARHYALLFFGFFSAGFFTSAGVSGFRADTTIEGIGIMNLYRPPCHCVPAAAPPYLEPKVETVCTWRMRCRGNHMPCTYHAYAMHMPCSCPTHALHMHMHMHMHMPYVHTPCPPRRGTLPRRG